MGRKSLLTSPSPKSKIQAPNPQESNSKRGNWTQGCQVIQGGQKEAEHIISKTLLKSLVVVTDPVDNPELFNYDHNLKMVQACPSRLKV